MLSSPSIVRAVLPEGTLPVGIGLALSGITTYAFLAIAARALGPVRYAPFAGLWSLLFLLSPALFAPFEQEVGRAIAARRVLDQRTWVVLQRCVALIGVVISAALVATVLGSGALLARLFDDDVLLLASLLIGLVTYAGSAVVKGTMSGRGRFGAYGGCLGGEGVFRLTAAVGLFAAGVHRPGPYALSVALAPLSNALFLPRNDDRADQVDEPFTSSEFRKAIWHLFVGSAFAATIVNGAPVALKAISTAADRAAVSRFTASLLIARVPLFLFQAIQVALLPKLSAMAAAGKHADFTSRLLRLLAFVTAIGLGSTVVASTFGPAIIRTVFGLGFAMKAGDLALLGLSSTLYMVALAFAQALIAYRNQRLTAVAWGLGCGVFGLALLAPTDVLFRVERSLLLGTAVAAVAMAFGFRAARAGLDAPAAERPLVAS
jgi:O-antigen/teichoic acid export membrane protein